VRAAQDGEVIFAGWRAGYGRCVVIQHKSNLQSWYGHNTEVLVEAGRRVRKGDRIALVGNTGDSTGPHCHFEIHQNGKPVSPLRYLAR
jgi:murein DD-endopeptidase MepM/ murein hydrolase activator NlpD